jgi:hypothetical protein
MSKRQAFDSAMRELRKSGMIAKRNVKGCCRGCIKIETDGKPLIWHYGGQGNAFTWRDDKAVLSYVPSWDYDGRAVEIIYFNHSGLVDEAGNRTDASRLVVDTFLQHGFGVIWDGTKSSCVGVILA